VTTAENYDGTEASAQSIAELYAEIEDVLSAAFPRSRDLWVRGEIQKISDGYGHAYIDVIDSDYKGDKGAPTLKVKCWKGTWGPLKASLRREGIELQAGMTVVMKGTVDFYKPRAEVGFIMSAVDTDALLGRIARDRQALIEALKKEDLFDAQRRLVVAEVPLVVGLVGSPGTEGFNDFLGQLERSGFSFTVRVIRASVQGTNAPREVAQAIATLETENLDLICVVRGGGSKADLAAFDAEPIARAIAKARVPVWTGIGHTGDESIADLVANERHITPTACGVAVVSQVASFWHDVAERARFLGERAESLMDEEAESHRALRHVIHGSAQRIVSEQTRELAYLRRQLIAAPSATLAAARAANRQRSQRIIPAAKARLAMAQAELDGYRRLLGAFDPQRTLARGWTLTMDASGRIVRSANDLAEGATLRTRMVDGEVTSTVTSREITKKGS